MSKGVNELMGDEILVRQARAGNSAAFVKFASRWWPAVARVAWSMLGSAAQALVVTEEVLTLALRSPKPLEMPIGVSMYRLVIWLAIVRRRSSKQRAEPETPVLQALDRVYCMDRAAFVLRDVEQVSIEDVAAILGSSVPEARQRVDRARLALTCALGNEVSCPELPAIPRLA